MLTQTKTDEVVLLQRLGDKLKYHRLEKGFTQENLSAVAGFSRSYYTEIETGKRNVSILNLNKISVALGIPLNILLDMEERTDRKQYKNSLQMNIFS
ncbi:helix-turn-helix domain-containing protein [Aquibacillus sp. 3ASR75-11]|uniref:Helix-turn-helix domain-containing protein n=1 Tax=Terrihalobacillus insolitus TaxID=2950438 RepID=A0A9X4ALZ1_9BACI|nr:helix-turn-helix transcriptional regulator [Terrihalobacillus insolitus]MDC3412329.1 helix-turn-helix domain-containing protein [Terrihalobacillus insolitus]MDC3422978.1 helix-turn-helix domain-containing protein [Terrihalobacillus insolitus]